MHYRREEKKAEKHSATALAYSEEKLPSFYTAKLAKSYNYPCTCKRKEGGREEERRRREEGRHSMEKAAVTVRWRRATATGHLLPARSCIVVSFFGAYCLRPAPLPRV